MKTEVTATSLANHEQLRQAFTVFSQASSQLSGIYRELQQQVSRLTEELALANGELQRELAAKEALSQQLGQLLTALPGGVVVLDHQDRISRVNPAAIRFLGEPLLGITWHRIEQERLQPTGLAGEWLAVKTATAAPDLCRIFIENSLSETTRESILLLHDITEAHALREQNRRNQRLAAMGEVAAGLAHQLRTPLSTALLYAGHLSVETLDAQERSSFAAKTIERLHYLEHLIRNMLQFVKGESVPAGKVKLSVLLRKLQQVMAPQMQQRQLRFVVEDNSMGSSLNVNRDALSNAVMNLLDNAVQIAPAGSLITLVCETTMNEARLIISDEGPGIDPVLHERVFEPFFTTRTEGTGLGLAIVHNLIQSMQGEIRIDSTPGIGTQFTICLPRAAKARANKFVPAGEMATTKNEDR
ncbi:PAS/PAC sensor signal transduction histidine kinase [Nitrosomonas eutropha]|uniref:sensor histidine kinase n=1 Tax=Nitrosomonas eutropha TaxID=916 RepID=UPI00088498F4|nr:ATP-binding protein [Nitrosomonas eutropha]SCX24570.1 PAS/PAC sensor signal transduction histidine kinase [Nitrosomonas eutropha]